MQRMGGGSRKTRKQRAGGNNPACGCDMQAGWPKFLTENIPLPTQAGGGCGAPPIPRFYQGGGACGACAGLPLPTPMTGGGQPTVYNSNPVPDACPFPGTGYCNFYARGGANNNNNNSTITNNSVVSYENENANDYNFQNELNMEEYRQHLRNLYRREYNINNNNNNYGNAMRRIYSNNNNNPGRNTPPNLQNLVENTTYNDPTPNSLGPLQGGANYGEPMSLQARLRGGGCGCMGWKGGYKPTKKNLKALKRWRRGESIGFTQTASLKAKGLIPRTSRKHKGKKIVSAKYK